MKKYTSLMVVATLGATLPLSGHVFAQDSTLKEVQNAISKGDTDISMRYRYERVDQDSIDKTANASTLLTRLTYKSADLNGFYGVFEVDNITAIGNENYNSTVNGNTVYPVVADPTLTEVNLAFVGYKTGGFDLSFGRQRINHNDQRFVGGVAWRQNEQTYDAYRVQYADEGKFKFDYSYVYNVNRIFGPDSPNADLQGNIHLLNVNYNLDKTHKLTAYAYELDFDTALAISTRTVGASYDGNVGDIKLHAAYAVQSDTGNNPNNFSTQYVALELGTKVSAVNVGIGYESLGSDNGVGFTTPLATLHKFQGFADKFLNTPGVGVNDLYVKASGKIGKVNLTAVYHQLDSDVGSIDYGNELNLIATYPVADKVSLLLKYANYSADGFAVDTNKFWSMVNFKF
ncbi:alginate export family protein [Glaciecola sp. XM2]|uniref:alginate export family protein n=1 Tax=Glaciecola sp. XM2 TaxID=1914931 RepID=UPI002032758A|nr:alginate export family protein [Glaciecola sp. XM2]